jgi:hypothetical protein
VYTLFRKGQLMEKYTIFHIDGGIGKHIAATAVARCIKNNYPDRKLIVVCAWPSPFVNLDFVDRVYKHGITPYFYQDYILNKDSLLFKHEPYFTSDHIHEDKALIQNWCDLYGLEYNGEKPTLTFNLREKQLAQVLWNSDKPIMAMQSSGGLFQQEGAFAYKWTRDMPIGVMNKIVEEFKPYYNIFQVTREGAPIGDGVVPVDKPYSVMELVTLLLRSEKRVFIDSMMQHAAVALDLPSTVIWIGTSPDIFGYQLHDNIVANQMHNFKLPDSYLFSYNFDGITHECPYKTEEEMFDVDEIISSIKRQGL